MGATCPKHKSYERIVQNLTVDQQPARTSKDVIGHILSCGCKFGNDQFMKVQETVQEVKAKFATLRSKIADEERTALAKELAKLETEGAAN